MLQAEGEAHRSNSVVFTVHFSVKPTFIPNNFHQNPSFYGGPKGHAAKTKGIKVPFEDSCG